MKLKALIIAILLTSFSSLAKSNSYLCLTSNDRTIVFQQIADTWKINLNKKSKKVGSCELQITEVSDPASKQVTSDMEFEVRKCQFEFDKFKPEYSVVNRGFIKINHKAQRAQAFILNNSQPLFL